MTPLEPQLTNVGLSAVLSGQHNGLLASITHIALGDAGLAYDGHNGYNPNNRYTKLKNARAFVALGGGNRVSPNEIEVQALYDDDQSYWIKEIGFIINGENDEDGNYVPDSGTLLAIYSSPDAPQRFKTAGDPMVVVYYVLLTGLPPGAVEFSITGPNVNITIVKPVALLSAEIIRAHRLGITAERNRVTPIIQNIWR